MPSFSPCRRPSPDYYQAPIVAKAAFVLASDEPTKLSTTVVTHYHRREILLCLLLAMAGHGLVGWFLFQSPADSEVIPAPLPVVMQLVAPPIAPPINASAPTEPAAAPPPPEATPAVSTPAPQPAKPTPKPATKKPAAANKAPPQSQHTEQPGKEVAAPQQTAIAKPPAPAPAPEQALVGPYGRAGYLNNPPPTYPPIAARLHQQGVVVLRVHVRADGHPEQVQVFTSSGFDSLDQAAIKAVNQWTFMPAKRGEVATDGWVNVPLAFKLSN